MKRTKKERQDVKYTMNFVREVFNATRWCVIYMKVDFFFRKGYELLWVRRSTLILLNVTSYVDTRKVRN
jgi:hypothetical protein